MIQSKKEYGINLLKKILTALHKKQFSDVIHMVDESSFDENDMIEYVQGTAEINDFHTIDEYREENIVIMDDESDNPFNIETYLSADDGEELPLVLKLKLEFFEDGTVKKILDVDAD